MIVAAESAPGAASLVQSVDWLAIAPPVTVAAVALVVLVADLFVPAPASRSSATGPSPASSPPSPS